MHSVAILVLLAPLVLGHVFHSAVRDPAGGWRVVPKLAADACATGYFEDTMLTIGWGELYVATSPSCSDADAMSAAGFLEGSLTSQRIYDNYYNLYGGLVPLPPAIESFLQTNLEFTQMSVSVNATPQAYWNHVGLVLAQLDGLLAGYNSVAPSNQQMTLIQMLALSAQGDLEDISSVAGVKHSPKARAGSHCSGLVKVTDDFSELYIGHSTWNVYASMTRVFKFYDFALSAQSTAATMISFSSYPGALLSIDDFYSNQGPQARLVSAETTNGCMNNSLLHFITPTTGVLSWIRTMVANRMAATALQWHETYGLFNSYTYNNQFYVVDYSRFTPGSPLVDGTVMISEQYPGGFVIQDVTQFVAGDGYWPSYNVPFTPEIYAICEFPQNVQQFGPYLFSYETCARAEIFRRNESAIYTVEDFQAMMRYNDWQNDPLSSGNAGLQISSRFDLVTGSYPNNPTLANGCFGATDSKMTSYGLSAGPSPQVWAQSGPTHDQQAPFAWTTGGKSCQQGLGQPSEYNFDFELFAFDEARARVAEAFGRNQ